MLGRPSAACVNGRQLGPQNSIDFNREKWLILIRPFEPALGSGREQGLLLVIQIDEGDVPGRLFCGKAAPDLLPLAESTPQRSRSERSHAFVALGAAADVGRAKVFDRG